MSFDEFIRARFQLVDGVVVGKHGVVLGAALGNGYVGTGVRFEGKWKRVLMHRLVFFLAHGYWPTQIDHINGVRSDNRLENLRAATASQNQANKRSSAKSGFKGVTKRTVRYAKPRYEAACSGKYIGVFDTPEQAAAAYDAAAAQRFGQYARLNDERTAA